MKDWESLALELQNNGKPQAEPEGAPQDNNPTPTPEPEAPIVSEDQNAGEQEPSNDSVEQELTTAEPNSNEDGTVNEDGPTGDTSEDTQVEAEELDLDNIEDWDAAEPNESNADEPATFDFSELSNALKEDGIKDKESLVEKFNALKKQAEEANKKAESAYEGIPDDLANAIELAKNGSDYREYLGLNSEDYSKADPIDLYEREAELLFTDAEGKLDEEALDDHLDSLSDAQKSIQGRQIQKQLIAEQVARNQEYMINVQEQKAKADEALKGAVNSLENVSGFKVNPEQKQTLYKGIKQGDLMKEFFYDKNGQYDYNKVAENFFKLKNFEKMQKFYKQKIRSATKREVLDDLTNPDVNKNTVSPNTTSEKPKKINPIDAWLNDLKK